MRLAPTPEISPRALQAGQADLVRDAAWGSVTVALSGGIVLVAFALYLGAGPLMIGLLSAIPVLAQIVQLPGIALIENLRTRKRVAVWTLTASRLVILALAMLPFVVDHRVALLWLVVAHTVVAVAGSIAHCAVNSWFHQLIAPEERGPFFSRRLLWGTLLAAVGTLVAGQAIERAGAGPAPWLQIAFAGSFAVAGLAGLVSSHYLARAPEPPMLDRSHVEPLTALLRRPLQDDNFRRLLRFLGSWAAASNLAAPFLTVYLVRQLGWGIDVVTALSVAGSLANAAALLLWGRLSVRIAHKSVLKVALPAYFACTALLVLPQQLGNQWAGLAVLAVLHVVMGAAAGGIALASSNLGLKLAPQGQGTSYLAMVGIVGAIGGGLAPLVAGAAGEWFEVRELSLVLRWQAPSQSSEVIVLAFAHWEFLFVISALAGLYVMHALSLVKEEGETGEREVIQEFAIEAARTVDNLSAFGGALGFLFPFRRFGRRKKP